MSMVDIAILAVLLIGLLRGLSTGLVRQVIGLGGLVVALVLAVELMPIFGSRTAGAIGVGEQAGRVAAFLLVFIVIELAFLLLARMAEAAAGALHLTFLNRIGGGLTGAFKAALLVSIALILLARVGLPSEETRRDSRFYGTAALIVPSAWDLAAVAWPRIQTLSSRFGDEVRSVLEQDAEPK